MAPCTYAVIVHIYSENLRQRESLVLLDTLTGDCRWMHPGLARLEATHTDRSKAGLMQQYKMTYVYIIWWVLS